MAQNTSEVSRRSKSNQDDIENSPHNATGRRERKPSGKVKEQRAMEAEKIEHIRVKKENKDRRDRRRLVVDDDNDNEDSDEHGHVDTNFTTRTVTTKAALNKEKALTQHSNRVPLSHIKNITPRRPSDMESNSKRGRTTDRATEHTSSRSRSHSHNSRCSHSLDSDGNDSQDSHSARALRASPRSMSYDSDEHRGSLYQPRKRRASTSPQSPRPPNKKSNRPKASNYDDVTQGLLAHANSEYRCKISTVNAFPNTGEAMGFAINAWQSACTKFGINMRLTPAMTKVIHSRLWQLRGEVKNKCQPFVETYFNFNTGQHRRIQVANRHRAEVLKQEYNFSYKFVDIDDPKQNVGLFKSGLIQKVVNVVWFRNEADEGIIFSEYFNPITKATLALVLTVIEACIDEWLTGTRIPKDFSRSYQTLYEENLEELNRFEQQTKKHDLLNTILIKLYNRGRFHAGARPMSIVGLSAIPESAFDAAMREYEDNPNTETDGENGDSD